MALVRRVVRITHPEVKTKKDKYPILKSMLYEIPGNADIARRKVTSPHFILKTLVDSLSEDERDIIQKRYFEGMQWPKISKGKGITISQMYHRSSVLLDKLHSMFISASSVYEEKVTGKSKSEREKEGLNTIAEAHPSIMGMFYETFRLFAKLMFEENRDYKELAIKFGVTEDNVKEFANLAKTMFFYKNKEELLHIISQYISSEQKLTKSEKRILTEFIVLMPREELDRPCLEKERLYCIWDTMLKLDEENEAN